MGSSIEPGAEQRRSWCDNGTSRGSTVLLLLLLLLVVVLVVVVLLLLLVLALC